MKKIWIIALWLFTLLFSSSFTQANENYEFTNLNITARIQKDWTVDIKENYTANFFVARHWIKRNIPLNYSVWWEYFHIYINNINVDWQAFTTYNYGDEREIKIWNENSTVLWEQLYPISYSTYGLIRNFSWKGYAELYWDLIWSQWNTNFKNFSAEILLPKPYTWFKNSDFLIKIWWTKYSINDFDWIIDRTSWNKIKIKYNKWLPAYTKFSLSIKFPNNYFEFDHNKQAKLIWRISENSNSSNLFNDFVSSQFTEWIVICIITIIILIISRFWKKINNWRKKSRINMWLRLRKWRLKWQYAKMFPVIVQYNPPKKDDSTNFSETWLLSNIKKDFSYKWLNPAEVWLLLHRKAKGKDLFTLIYKRAYENIIEIKPGKNDSIIITKLKEIPGYYPEYEMTFFYNLFSHDKIEITKNINLHHILNLKSLETYWVEKWWLKNWENKEKLEKFLRIALPIRIASFISMFLVIFLWMNFALYRFIWTWIIWVWLFTITIILTSRLDIYEETKKWAKLISHILWYREFLAKCDEEKFRTFLKQDPLYFDKILPYAIVFGLDSILIDRLSPIMKDMNIASNLYSWDFNHFSNITNTISSVSFTDHSHSSYSSSSWWSGWSSFDSSSSSGWGGGGWSDW